MIVETVIFSLCYFHVYFLYSYVLLLFYYYCHYCYSLLRLLLLSFVRISHNIFFCGFCIDHDIFRLSHPGHCALYGRRVSFASLTLNQQSARPFLHSPVHAFGKRARQPILHLPYNVFTVYYLHKFINDLYMFLYLYLLSHNYC